MLEAAILALATAVMLHAGWRAYRERQARKQWERMLRSLLERESEC